MSAQFDPIKNVYRVYNADGSFNTYTPEQYRALENVAPIVEEEEEGDADIVLEIKDTDVSDVKDTDVSDVKDTPVLDNVVVDTDDIKDITDEVVEEVPTTGDAPVDSVPTTGYAPVGQTITGDLNPQN